jgi:hypothetical protein
MAGKLDFTIAIDISDFNQALKGIDLKIEETATKPEKLNQQFKKASDATKEALSKINEASTEAFKKLNDASSGANGVSEAIGAMAGKFTGLPIGEATEFFNKIKDGLLEVDHLSHATGLSVEKIVEFKDVMEDAGVSSEHFPEILGSLSGAMSKVNAGSTDTISAFNALGVSTKGWKQHLPSLDVVLLQVADHIKSSHNPTQDLAAATAILGEHANDLIPILKMGSAAIKQQMAAHKEHADAVKASIQSAKELQLQENKLSNDLGTLMLPVFRAVVFVVRMFEAGLAKLWAGFKIVIAVVVESAKEIWYWGQALVAAYSAISKGDFSGMVKAFTDLNGKLEAGAKDTAKYITDTWAEGNRQADEILKDHFLAEEEGDKGLTQHVNDQQAKRTTIVALHNKNRSKIVHDANEEIKADTLAMFNSLDKAAMNSKVGSLMLGIGSAPKPRLGDDHGVKELQKAEEKKGQIVKKSTDYRGQLEQTLAKNMESFFSSSIMGMINGTESLASAISKLGQQMLQSVVDMLSQMLTKWIETHILMKLFGITTSEETAQAGIAASAATGGAAAGASVAAIPITGWSMVAPVSEAAYTQLSSFIPRVNFHAAGGYYEVNGDQIGLVHDKEMVLPAGIANRLRSTIDSMGEGGGSGRGINVNVYHSVNAIDASSFKDTIRQHGNMIGNEVARVIRRNSLLAHT